LLSPSRQSSGGGDPTFGVPPGDRHGAQKRTRKRGRHAKNCKTVAALVYALASTGIVAQETSEGIRVMARERSLAEQFLVIMHDFGQKDIGQYVKGVTLYAEAKAEFDGLISELEHELEQAGPPDQSERFEAALKDAVAKRVAFTSFVTDTLVPHTEGAQNGIAGTLSKGKAT
jgi:hypothetical protein